MEVVKNEVHYDDSISLDAFLKEYDDMLLGKRKSFSAALLDRENEATVCAGLLRRIFKHYLHWTPTQIRDCLTLEIAERMCLMPFIRRLNCPPELDNQKDLFFVAWELYPETKNVSEPDLIRRVYQNLLDGTIQRFPKGYFDGYKGMLRAHLIFKTVFNEYLVSNYSITSLEDAYDLFTSPDILSIIEKYKLTTLVRSKFEIPLNLLHSALGKEADNKLYIKALSKYPACKWAYCRLTTKEILAANDGVKPPKMVEYEKRVKAAGSYYYSYGDTVRELGGTKQRGRPKSVPTDAEIMRQSESIREGIDSIITLEDFPTA